jgi:hypothetical protein
MGEIVVIGIGATLVMDSWGLIRGPLFGIAAPDYRLLGRWIAHMGHGQFRHASIAAAAPIRGEKQVGWIAHYLTGIMFAALLVGVFGRSWTEAPTLGPALLVGIGTTAAPFFLMQPAMGAGIAAHRTSHPASARLQTLVTHSVFGFGLFATAWVRA